MSTEGLDRFLAAQQGVIADAMAELANGRKTSHWMWFVFPQLRGLGRSESAIFYGLDGLEEAERYAAHPVLAPRLRAAAELVLSHAGTARADAILGPIDAQKLRSTATLFARPAPTRAVFKAILAAFYNGSPCPRTIERLT